MQKSGKLYKLPYLEARYTKHEFHFVLFLALFWISNPTLDLLRGVLLHMGPLKFLADIISPLAWFLGVVIAIPHIIKNIRPLDIIFYLFICSFYFLNYVFYPSHSPILDQYYISFLLLSLPFFFVGLSLNTEKSLPLLYQLSRFVIVIKFLYTFVYGGDDITHDSGENMFAAYTILPHAVLVSICFLKKKNWLDLIFIILSVFQIMVYNNRGSILTFLISIFIYLFFVKRYKYSVMAKTLLVIGLLAIIQLFDDLMIWMFEFMYSRDYSLRVLNMIEEQSFFESSGRSQIFHIISNNIDKMPVFGFGIAGDRTLGNIAFAHNIILEIIVSYGYIVGSIVIISMILTFIRGVYLSNNPSSQILVLVLVCTGFFPLMVSGTYLELSSMLFLAIGLCIRQIRKKDFKTVTV